MYIIKHPQNIEIKKEWDEDEIKTWMYFWWCHTIIVTIMTLLLYSNYNLLLGSSSLTMIMY